MAAPPTGTPYDAADLKAMLQDFLGETEKSGVMSAAVLDLKSKLEAYAAGVRQATTLEERELAKLVETALVSTSIPELRFLPSGESTVSASDLLSSSAMDQVLVAFRSLAEVIVIDCPPVLPLADTGVLAAKGGVVLLVLDMGRTRRQVARAAKDYLLRSRAALAGAVLNRAPRGSLYRHYQRKTAAHSVAATQPTIN